VITLRLDALAKDRAPLSVLALGAHPDDLEIAAGGLLLDLAARHPGLHVRYVLFSGTPERQLEAQAAARAFTSGAELQLELYNLPDGRFPAAWTEVKDILEGLARSPRPDIILAPSAGDAHQDHRTVGELVPTAFRDQLCLAYEIPKWDGDLPRPNVYFALTPEIAERKAELLDKCYPSQQSRDWWSAETFLALAKLRGVECRARYAEAFTCSKMVIA
jgi:LmbE family N-acetylglucosaminyl deacetylase